MSSVWLSKRPARCQFKLWTLDERNRTDLIEVYQIIHSLATVKFESFLEFENYSRTLGHIYKLKKNVSTDNRDLREHFFY